MELHHETHQLSCVFIRRLVLSRFIRFFAALIKRDIARSMAGLITDHHPPITVFSFPEVCYAYKWSHDANAITSIRDRL